MSVSIKETIARALPELRVEPSAKRIRAQLAGQTVADTVRAALVWEPRRVVPSWAVPTSDLSAELSSGAESEVNASETVGDELPDFSATPILTPSTPFGVHSTPGLVIDLVVGDRTLRGAGFRPSDPALSDYVVLDFAAFDEWWEEDARNIAHPRDPFHRIDVLPASRSVKVELDGELLAESNRAVLLFETMLPTRCYLPREDIRVQLQPTAMTTQCAYKGTANYLSAVLPDRTVENIAWTYREPMVDAISVKDMICFFNERVDVSIAGVRERRPRTPWS